MANEYFGGMMNKLNVGWQEAKELLTIGNERFIAGLRSTEALLGNVRLKELAENGQRPFAIILSCSDSRVPAELLFDRGFGDLFVVRVAGNIAQPSQIASIEYAAKVLQAPLCVVMGHSQCGAVQATLNSETGDKAELGPNLNLLFGLIRPAVARCLSATDKSSAPMLDRCIEENVKGTANKILKESSILRTLAAEARFHVAEAVFRLESGKVEFLP